MPRPTIAIMTAMPEETRPILRLLGARPKPDHRTIFTAQRRGIDLLIVQSGMGRRHAGNGVQELLTAVKPALVISCGVGGAVRPGLRVGDVVTGRSVYLMTQDKLLDSPVIPKPSGNGHDGTIITCDHIRTKAQVAAHLPSTLLHPVLDMETFAVAEAAGSAGIPFMAVRAISDAADEELQFSLEEFTDNELNLKLSKVMITILKKPYIIPQLIRLAWNTKTAAENLAHHVAAIIDDAARQLQEPNGDQG